jgi:hypothetical protein
MPDTQLKAKLSKFSRCKPLSIIRYHNLRDGEFKKIYPLLKSLCGRSSRGLLEGNYINKLRKRVHTY